MKCFSALATLSLVASIGLPALPASAQSRTDRVSQIATSIAGAIDNDNTVYTDARTGQTLNATPRQLMRETLSNVDYDAMPAKLALDIWSNQTGVALVINWKALEKMGIDPQAPVTLKLRKVPAEQVLRLIVQQIHPDPIGDDRLMVDVQEWYVRVMTKRDALRNSTTKMYFIGDLLMTVPNFSGAPGFDLNDALSNTNSGGSNGGGGGGQGNSLFFADTEEAPREPTKAEKAENIADVIRDSIEPDIWLANGGEYASVRYLRGMLIVKAPDYIHEQIGVPFSNGTKKRTGTSRSSATRSTSNNTAPQHRRHRSTPGKVAGVER